MSSKPKSAAAKKSHPKQELPELAAKNVDEDDSPESREVVEKLTAVVKLDPELESRLSPELLDRVSKNPKVIALFQEEFFQGPLPPPAMLQHYNDILPGGAERIFRLTEKEQDHRHRTQSSALDGAVSRDRRGQWMGFSISILVLVMAAYFANKGAMLFAGTLATLDLVGLATVFVFGRKYQKKNSDKS